VSTALEDAPAKKRCRPRPTVVMPADPSLLPHLLSVDEAAELLRTTRKAIYARIERGLLPGVVRDGRRVLLLRDDVLGYIAERRAATPGDRR
jgi:excisionase family DNA binding protein